MPRPFRRKPPFCPNPSCDFHVDPEGWRFKKAGFYHRLATPHRIQRYRCQHCGRSFSSQTFDPTYGLKRPDLLEFIYGGLNACSCLRQMARILGVSPSTVMGQSARLGRHALLFLAQHRPAGPPPEPVVIDGLETFEFSQYYPVHINVAVGAESHYLHAFTDAELRRKGRMTPRQKRKNERDEARYGRPDPKAIERSIGVLTEMLAPEGGTLRIRSDEHRAYPRGFRRAEGVRVIHERTSSKAARTAGNPLFPVNRVDGLVRHCSANHKRETIAYSKRRQAMAERFAVFGVWNNFQKSFSEKRRDATPAQRLGVAGRKLTTRDILRVRLFPSRVELPERWQTYYDGRVPTRRIPNGRRHDASYTR